MNQYDFLDFFKAHPKKWFNAKQIAQITKSSQNCVSERMRSLRKFQLIEYEERQDHHQRPTYYYRAKCET